MPPVSGRPSSKRAEGVKGLTDRKICIAVTLGVIIGGVISLLQLNSSGTPLPLLNRLNEEDDNLDPKDGSLETQSYQDLKTKFDNLRKEHFLLIEERDKALNKLEDVIKTSQNTAIEEFKRSDGLIKVGPPGTVKAPRTSPTVTPDRSVNPALADILEKIAINKELIVGISSFHIHDMLAVWFQGIQRVGIKNYLVVALDDATKDFCERNNVPVYRRDAKIAEAQKDAGLNHAISGTKFHLLREFLQLGYSVFLSDVDILYLKNPFDHLHRDCDVEGMSDGYDNYTAYGYNDVFDDPSMGWARYAHTMRVYVFNSGLFYIRPTIASIELLDRVTHRLATEKGAWDQAVFNEELFFPSHPGYLGLHASKRVLDMYDFMNSKVMFKFVRKDSRFANFMPVTLHVNYHPEKYERLLALVEYYIDKKKNALDRFPDGSIQ